MDKLLKKIDKVLPFHIGNVAFFAEFYSVLQKLMYNLSPPFRRRYFFDFFHKNS